ncbi:MAG: HEAT repeat domain-containing protein [Sulfurimicrobium sp.]|nr:HEAT repeat domain-containing protein [Sulfurimicrobium sp.]MDP1703364.1 HEAT repeat domain-containing protein [Sulfurimicrobium sp.]MDP2198524.1 HEAT repeat domain-containing protein [Sulfurimicrobium sp.]MDP3687009.1 HEAT repeat domain-containing protein [Sulfurimicrobium sp.]
MAEQREMPDALLLLAPGCPHCPAVLEGLSGLVKEGAIGRLEAVNIAVHPERAAALGVRGVPWCRVGDFELEGVQTPGDLHRWAELSGTPRGMPEYFLHLLKHGRRDKVEAMARREPRRLLALVMLLADESSMAVRLGIGAVLEEFQGDAIAEVMIPGLGELTRHADALTRADACHYLSLIGGERIVPYLKTCLADENAEVREIAAETLAEMGVR